MQPATRQASLNAASPTEVGLIGARRKASPSKNNMDRGTQQQPNQPRKAALVAATPRRKAINPVSALLATGTRRQLGSALQRDDPSCYRQRHCHRGAASFWRRTIALDAGLIAHLLCKTTLSPKQPKRARIMETAAAHDVDMLVGEAFEKSWRFVRTDPMTYGHPKMLRALVATPAATGAGRRAHVWRLANGAIADVRRELAAA